MCARMYGSTDAQWVHGGGLGSWTFCDVQAPPPRGGCWILGLPAYPSRPSKEGLLDIGRRRIASPCTRGGVLQRDRSMTHPPPPAPPEPLLPLRFSGSRRVLVQRVQRARGRGDARDERVELDHRRGRVRRVRARGIDRLGDGDGAGSWVRPLQLAAPISAAGDSTRRTSCTARSCVRG